MKLNLQPNLENELVRLRPLESSDFDMLYAVAKDPKIWEQHPCFDRYKSEVFAAFFQDSLDSKGALIIIDKKSNTMIGSSRFKKHHRSDNAIEIGWSFLARNYWGGQFNKAVKQLMIGYALATVDHVVFFIGPDNIRSQRAVEKIGGIIIKEPEHQFLCSSNSTDLTYRIGNQLS